MLPVRPPPSPQGEGDVLAPAPSEVSVIDDPEEVDMKNALSSEPIVGLDKVLMDEDGPGALQPTPLPSPRRMTPAQQAIHDLTHLP